MRVEEIIVRGIIAKNILDMIIEAMETPNRKHADVITDEMLVGIYEDILAGLRKDHCIVSKEF